MMRVVVVGARRTRQGIGEFVARAFHQAGAQVVGVVGSSQPTARDAADKLQASYGIEAQAFATLEEALAKDPADIVALCSPYLLHRQQLQRLAKSQRAAGLPLPHLLCEKPMWWDADEADLATATAELIDPFLEAGRAFELVTQWPCTLPHFFELYPHQEHAPRRHFEMLLSPITTSSAAVLDSVPHVLSMLQTLCGSGSVANAAASYKDGEQSELWLDFEYTLHSRLAHGGEQATTVETPSESSSAVAVKCRFSTCPERPRPAGYGLNGDWVDRTIELPAYNTGFRAADGRQVAVPDPLDVLVGQFLKGLADRSFEVELGARRQALLESVTQLKPLVRVVKNLEESE